MKPVFSSRTASELQSRGNGIETRIFTLPGMGTRFKYKEVAPVDFGMDPVEVGRGQRFRVRIRVKVKIRARFRAGARARVTIRVMVRVTIRVGFRAWARDWCL